MSERLEEIKKTVYKMHGEELEYNPNDEIAHIWYKDMKWLIQQAEQVELLENELKHARFLGEALKGE